MTGTVEFQVTYNAAEYRSFAADKVAQEGHRPGFFGRLFLFAVASLAFAYKSRKVGSCSFRFDANGVRRRSKVGEMTIPWERIVAVTRFSQCYLMELERGGLPVPYRCLDAGQREAFERLVRENTKAGTLRALEPRAKT
jgi:hypothetical protein